MITYLKGHLLKRYNQDEQDFKNVMISREKEPLSFQVERLNRRKNDGEAIHSGLKRAGTKPVKVFEQAFER